MKKISLITIIAAAALTFGIAPVRAQQYPILLHSHNDYSRTMPFYEAYSQHLFSVECDMYYTNGKFLVGHDPEDLKEDVTFDRLYLEPLINVYNLNGGRPYAGSEEHFQLVVEIKSDNTDAYMKAFVEKIKKYPEIFDPSVNPYACHIVVTGHVPSPDKFSQYPSYVTFDGDINENYTPEQLKQVGMISMCFASYSVWNGKGTIIAKEKAVIEDLIARVHALGKPIRFWGAPESVTVWTTFYSMGVD